MAVAVVTAASEAEAVEFAADFVELVAFALPETVELANFAILVVPAIEAAVAVESEFVIAAEVESSFEVAIGLVVEVAVEFVVEIVVELIVEIVVELVVEIVIGLMVEFVVELEVEIAAGLEAAVIASALVTAAADFAFAVVEFEVDLLAVLAETAWFLLFADLIEVVFALTAVNELAVALASAVYGAAATVVD